MEYHFFTTLNWFTTVLIGSLGMVIYIGSKNLSSRVFVFNIGLIVIWSFAVSLLPLATDPIIENNILKLTFYLGGLISAAFFYFCLAFPNDHRPSKKVLFVLIAIQFVFIPLYFNSGIIIGPSFRISSDWGWGQLYGPLWFLFDAFFLFFWIGGVSILVKKYLNTPYGQTRKNLGYMILGLLIGFIPPNVFSIILPRLGYFDLNWLGPVSGNLWVCIIAYSIIRYRQMNVRAILTEVLAIAMAAIFFINIFIDTSFGLVGRIVTFAVFLILAYYLIRGTLREAEQREQLADLNHNLEARVAAQTLEIRKAYEAEKHARLELEKLNDAKDQFIMITQHHLRTPVNSMLWALESALAGAYGKVASELKAILQDTHASGKRLMRIVDDFLNITAIKIGTNILDITSVSLKPAIEDILAELKESIAKMNLTIQYPEDDEDWPVLKIDYSKMRESLFIIFENAVRYNREGGSIKVTTGMADGAFKLIVENTGLGISPEESNKIGSAMFYRGEFARKAYPIGMGVGLSVVKAIIRAHHGTFAIESRGSGQGAKVTVTMPL